MSISTTQPHTVEGLLRVIEARDSELALLKLMGMPFRTSNS